MTHRATTPRRATVLAVLCLAAFAVNVDITIVNVTLPALVRELDASNRELQWIVDAYTLTFAALVLAAGSLSDRYGRRGGLLIGTAVYGTGNLVASLCETSDQLVAARALMGVGAALIFPTTLSIISNVFPERGARARAIGVWGASTGLAVALGPITGGALLESFWWGSTFLVKVPLALAVIVAVLLVVPTSRDPEAPRLDVTGLVLSVAVVALLVHAVIEAPARGWLSAATLGQLTAAAAVGVAFVLHERRTAAPMLDVRTFADRRFSVSSAAVTVSFFALAGFIFLITQYFQFLKGYSPLETGVRIVPVALAVAVSSLVGTRAALRLGNGRVVGTGLALLAVAYGWISTASAATGYVEIALQMLVLGSGMGLTSAPATEALMGAVSTAKAGMGSAVNDAAREMGATLGVAVIGSVFASLYVRGFDGLEPSGVPAEAVAAGEESIGAAQAVAAAAAGQGRTDVAAAVTDAAASGFFDGLAAGCLVAAGVAAVAAVATWVLLPGRPAVTEVAVSPSVDGTVTSPAEAAA